MHRIQSLLIFGIFCYACNTTTTSEQTDFGTAEEEDGGTFVAYNNPPAEGFNTAGSDMLAMLLADKCMQAMGGREAWDATRFISWNFFGRRDHLWDKKTGDVRIEDTSNGLVVLMNINSKEGSVTRRGEPVIDSLDHFLQQGYSWWVNDSYWLVMPFKLKDSGVTLKYFGEDTTAQGEAADVIQMTFKEIGLTPQNVYEVWIDTDSKLVNQWAFYPDSTAQEPMFITPWAGYEQYGDILLAGNRGDYSLKNISVVEEVPDGIFEEHNVMIASLK
ncbi:MAG: hypothetical protein AAF616_10150 [Bacteroidota bacterium]